MYFVRYLDTNPLKVNIFVNIPRVLFLVTIPCALEQNVHFSTLNAMNINWLSIYLPIYLSIHLISVISRLIYFSNLSCLWFFGYFFFCLFNLAFPQTVVSITPKIILDWFISPCSSVSFCFMYFETIFLDASKFIGVIPAFGGINICRISFFFYCFSFILSVSICFSFVSYK